MVKTTFLSLGIEDKGRTHVFCNEIKIEPFLGDPAQARLTGVADDRDRPKFYHVQLGLLFY